MLYIACIVKCQPTLSWLDVCSDPDQCKRIPHQEPPIRATIDRQTLSLSLSAAFIATHHRLPPLFRSPLSSSTCLANHQRFLINSYCWVLPFFLGICVCWLRVAVRMCYEYTIDLYMCLECFSSVISITIIFVNWYSYILSL